jgi:hypothetical protein
MTFSKQAAYAECNIYCQQVNLGMSEHDKRRGRITEVRTYSAIGKHGQRSCSATAVAGDSWLAWAPLQLRAGLYDSWGRLQILNP